MWLAAEGVKNTHPHTNTIPALHRRGEAFQEPGWLQTGNGRRTAVFSRVSVTHTQKKGGPEAKMDVFPRPRPMDYNSPIDLNI